MGEICSKDVVDDRERILEEIKRRRSLAEHARSVMILIVFILIIIQYITAVK